MTNNKYKEITDLLKGEYMLKGEYLVVDLSRLHLSLMLFTISIERRRLWVRYGGCNPWIDIDTMALIKKGVNHD